MNRDLASKSNSTIGIKEYELSDHLGNVSVVILDRKIFDGDKFAATSISRTDYYPFGYPIASRSFSLEQYRYGFNGQEGDGEIYGDKLNYAFQYRMYDARIGRFWSVDPLKKTIHGISSYCFSYNSPIVFNDPNGKAGIVTVTENLNGGGTITLETVVFLYGENAYQTAIDANKNWATYVKDGKNQYTYYDENNKPWIVKIDVVYVYTESIDMTKTVNDNQKDINTNAVDVTGVDPSTGKIYSFQEPGYAGSMICAIATSTVELNYVSNDNRNAGGFGNEGGGLSILYVSDLLHEVFHGFGFDRHMSDLNDVLHTYGAGPNIHPIHFIDFAKQILQNYREGRFQNGISRPYSNKINETLDNKIEQEIEQQNQRKDEIKK